MAIRLSDRKVLYFIEGVTPTANELAQIQQLEGNIGVRSLLQLAQYGSAIESVDAVSAYNISTIPAPYSFLPLARYYDGGANIIRPKGVMPGSRIATQGFSNAAGRMARMSRKRKKLPFAWRYYRAAIPLFYPAGSNPIVDTLYSGSQAVMRFQHTIEYPFTSALTGLNTPRFCTLWNKMKSAEYDNSVWDASEGWLVSDIMDLGYTLPAFTWFGEWCTVELPTTGTNVLPYTQNATNYLQRYSGSTDSVASLLTDYGGATDAAINATSITDVGTTQGGLSNFFMPVMLLPYVDHSVKTVGIIDADSLGYGIGEGVGASGLFGDSMGSAEGNAGWLDRFVNEKAKMATFNFARGSDRNLFFMGNGQAKYRLQGAALARPDVLVMECAVNDIGSLASATGWAAATAVAKFAGLVSGGSAAWMVVKAGTTAGSQPTAPANIGDIVVDNTARLLYLGAPATTQQRMAFEQFARICACIERVKKYVPHAKVVWTIPTFSIASSTDSFKTPEGQTPNTNWANGATSVRGYLAAMLRNPVYQAIAGIHSVLDPNPAIESATNSCKYKGDGVTDNLYSLDGVHVTSYGIDQIVQYLPANSLDVF